MADDKHAEKQGPAAHVSGKIDLETVRQLAALMSQHDLAELEVEQDDMAVRLRKGGATPAPAVSVVPVAAPVVPVIPAAGPAPAAPGAAAAEARAADLPAVKSPMVGTYYAASGPDAPPYVKVGDHVSEDTVVCVIEAMKVFNEIRAEMSGTIERVLVKSAQAVEFGQPLFAVRPE
ncbi:MAG: acetyl-CoA carboxylase biotin carboxyl carrier protein [Planctomycetes bacterium]|nr:acetyl-CoA carboxylase biotin carboxyl carrier protein [Planctomycetota bacterium]